MYTPEAQITKEQHRAQWRREKDRSLPRVINASLALQAILGMTTAHNVAEASMFTPLLQKPPVLEQCLDTFVAVATGDVNSHSDREWWENTGIDSGAAASTKQEEEESNSSNSDCSPLPGDSPTEFDNMSFTSEPTDLMVENTVENGATCSRIGPQKQLITPSNRPCPAASPTTKLTGASSMLTSNWYPSTAAPTEAVTPNTALYTEDINRAIIWDDTRDNVIMETLLQDVREITYFPKLTMEVKCLRFLAAANLSLFRPSTKFSVPNPFSVEASKERCDILEASKHDSAPVIPEIVIHQLYIEPAYQRLIAKSELPWIIARAPPTLAEEHEGAQKETQHPRYWVKDISSRVNAWLKFNGTIFSEMELTTLQLIAETSTRGRRSVCIGIHAHKGRSAARILLLHMQLPSSASNLLFMEPGLEWFVIHILWAADHSDARFTTLVFRAAAIIRITELVETARSNIVRASDGDRLLSPGASSSTYKLHYGVLGETPMASGYGLDEWALEDFMMACTRGDGVITITT